MKPEFYIMAFPELEYLWYILFVGVLLFFLMAICGNLLIIVLICLVPHLHTPMYFFLCNLAAQDVIYVSAILPKLMCIFLTGDHNISFTGCFTQMFMFSFCVATEFCLLTSMAYDRYVAICIPLQYSIIMHFKKCSLMALACWVVHGLNAALYTLLMSQLAFCHIKAINHFFCDARAILKLSIGNITHIKIIIFIESLVLGFIPFALILISYSHIIFAIQKIKSTTGRLKTFSGCSSHIITVILFFGASLSQYINPEPEFKEQDKMLSLLYVAVVPMLNPLVYSLRNKDVLQAMKKLFLCLNMFKE
ncbi:PREDICTED: olfactory receptor 10AG1-like [Nanorana parkeri]|uniref:olfactory receptor 10AG1-like n=1 Tax=Nanorana parkeri TaxID=125878 RepID=UPI0008547830|nr:PREDICTED: olfactory receptor 10AG1-like [Nanorana parkeri]